MMREGQWQYKGTVYQEPLSLAGKYNVKWRKLWGIEVGGCGKKESYHKGVYSLIKCLDFIFIQGETQKGFKYFLK